MEYFDEIGTQNKNIIICVLPTADHYNSLSYGYGGVPMAMVSLWLWCPYGYGGVPMAMVSLWLHVPWCPYGYGGVPLIHWL